MASSEDRIVQEMDVFLCNGELGGDTRTMLLQYPLVGVSARPAGWPASEHLKLKPKHGRVQVETPVVNENGDPVEGVTPSLLQLEGRSQPPESDLAVGLVSGGALYVVPVDSMAAMRPTFSHLEKREEPVRGRGHQLTQMSVQITRRETEAQIEARRRSYAYLASEEAREPWAEMRYHAASSDVAEQLVERLKAVETHGVPNPMSTERYLEALLPRFVDEVEEIDAPNELTTRAGASAAGARLPSPASEPQHPFPSEHLTAFEAALVEALRSENVMGPGRIRAALSTRAQELPWIRDVVRASAAEIAKAARSSSRVEEIRGRFVLRSSGGDDPIREVIMGILRKKDSMRKSEVQRAALEQGIDMTEHAYSKIIKELCTSAGPTWSFKKGI